MSEPERPEPSDEDVSAAGSPAASESRPEAEPVAAEAAAGSAEADEPQEPEHQKPAEPAASGAAEAAPEPEEPAEPAAAEEPARPAPEEPAAEEAAEPAPEPKEPAAAEEPAEPAATEEPAEPAAAEESAEPAPEPEEPSEEPAEPLAADDAPAPDPAAPALAEPKRWPRRLGLALVALLVLLLLLPTILSQGFLSAILRSQAGASVGQSEVSWTGGVQLQALDREHRAASPGDMGYAFWCRELALETSLVGSAWAGATGGEVRAKVVLRGAGLRLELGDGSAPAEESPPPPGKEPSKESEGDSGRPCGAAIDLVLDGFDVHLRQANAPLMILEGLQGQGQLALAKDGSFQLTAPLELELRSLRVPLGTVEQPWDGLLDVRGAKLLIKRLVLPAAGPPVIEAEVSSPSLHVYGLEFRDARLTAQSEGPAVVLGLTGDHPGAKGTLAFSSRVNRSNATRWPVSLDLDLEELPVRGVMGDLVPVLLPMVHSVNDRAGRFPPVSLHSRGQFDLVFGEEGIDGQATLDSLQAKGKVGLAPGKLESSILLRGYVSALTQLEVGGVLGAFLPQDWAFEGGESPFDVVGERFKLHSFPLKTQVLDLRLGAEVGMVSGEYDATVKGRGRGELPEQAEAVLGSLDRAGGIGLRGNLWEITDPAVVLPSRDVLLKAVKAEGAGGVWLERGGSLLEGVGEGLRLPR